MYLTVAKRKNLKNYHYKKKMLTLAMDVNQTYYDCCTICTHTESLCCMLETNIMYVNHTSVKN